MFNTVIYKQITFRNVKYKCKNDDPTGAIQYIVGVVATHINIKVNLEMFGKQNLKGFGIAYVNFMCQK